MNWFVYVVQATFRLVANAGYHQTSLSLGRWGGSKSLESRPRDLSKKQRKRRLNKIKAKDLKVDHAQKKLKDNFINKQIDSPEFNEALKAENYPE